jgi:radical SAM protein with 4Fe4S-binding SPASM domain
MEKKIFSITTAALHITYFCTHACPMCYANAGVNPNKHPPLERLLKVVDKLSEANIKEISLVGGDPASYPQIGDLCKYIHNKGVDISILSNTLCFSGISNIEIAEYISAFEGTIHSHIPEEHDNFCKTSGAFKQLVDNLYIFKSLGKKIGITLNIIPRTSEKLFDIVYELVETHKLALDYIVLQRIVPMGRADNKTDFILFKHHIDNAMQCIKNIDEKLKIKINVEDPFPICLLEEDHKKYMNHKCEWGWSKVAVNPEGKLSRCGADPRFILGDLFDKPLLQIWNESDILQSFRSYSYLPGRCQICENLSYCGGGCPLSCSLDKDHDRDYLITNYLDHYNKINGQLEFINASNADLSRILQLEWANFSKYQHVFNSQSIKKWFEYNPSMFFIVVDMSRNIFGYAIIVPMVKRLFDSILLGEYSSLIDFPMEQVKQNLNSDYFHMEVIATIPGLKKASVAGCLIKGIGNFLSKYAKFVTASPMTSEGKKLAQYFGFEIISKEIYNEEIYPIAKLEINNSIIEKMKLF